MTEKIHVIEDKQDTKITSNKIIFGDSETDYIRSDVGVSYISMSVDECEEVAILYTANLKNFIRSLQLMLEIKINEGVIDAPKPSIKKI